MSLTGGIPESITGLKGLRFLGLNDNKLTGDIPSKLASLPNVSALYLHGNNLTGEIKFSVVLWETGEAFWGLGIIPNYAIPLG
ncbi:UNVERIFIED_CONTAM: hypothetical protein Slati_1821200 [Sesamum latifolium]|uniref:Uncharacterized protein n=1 Tax=Sesamum latifolium TaxID=2727402 RepID=A0AAW2WZY3_9LAMI